MQIKGAELFYVNYSSTEDEQSPWQPYCHMARIKLQVSYETTIYFFKILKDRAKDILTWASVNINT